MQDVLAFKKPGSFRYPPNAQPLTNCSANNVRKDSRNTLIRSYQKVIFCSFPYCVNPEEQALQGIPCNPFQDLDYRAKSSEFAEVMYYSLFMLTAFWSA
jgi:hypothetical protein